MVFASRSPLLVTEFVTLFPLLVTSAPMVPLLPHRWKASQAFFYSFIPDPNDIISCYFFLWRMFTLILCWFSSMWLHPQPRPSSPCICLTTLLPPMSSLLHCLQNRVFSHAMLPCMSVTLHPWQVFSLLNYTELMIRGICFITKVLNFRPSIPTCWRLAQSPLPLWRFPQFSW